MAEEYTQVNSNLSNDDVRNLDRMMVEDGFDNRSAFVRKLVRQEWARRYPPTGEKYQHAQAAVVAETTN